MSRSHRPLLALLSVVPLLALGGATLATPFGEGPPDREVTRASTTATASTEELVCPGPLHVPEGLSGAGGDTALASSGPSDAVGVRTLALDADSSLLFGRVAASTTSQDADGSVAAPTITSTTPDGDDVDARTSAADLGAATQKIPSISSGPQLTLHGSADEQVIGDAVQTTTTTTGDFRSLTATRCAAPTTEASFLGASTATGASASLWLSNPSDRPATASVQVWTADGPAEMGGRSQVVVAPGTQERVLLESIVPDQDVIGASVSTVGAPLAMALQDTERDGLTPKGAEMLAAQPAASEHAVVPGVHIGAGTGAGIVLMNSTGHDATVDLAAQDAGGAIDVPALADPVTVPAGSVTTVPVTGLRGNVVITADSDQPITTAVRSRVVSDKALGKTIGKPSDLAVAPAAPALRSAGVLALPGDGTHGGLWLEATDDTSVTVIPVGEDGGAGDPVQVDLTAGRMGEVSGEKLTGTHGAVAGLVVVPDDPDVVHAAWIQTESDAKSGPLLTSVPVLPQDTGGSGTEVRLG